MDRTALDRTLDACADVIPLKPSFVARTFYPGLGRLGLSDPDAGSRGSYCERWIGSSVQADNAEFVEGEGMSTFTLADGSPARLADALQLAGERLLGPKHAARTGSRFGLLSKVLDIGTPIPWHIHARETDARKWWSCRGKEEAYYFVETENPGPVPFSHLGVHPDVEASDLLPILERWDDDSVLDLSPAYRLNVGQGFHVPPGIPHAPGTALTLELQEESDVYNFLQAVTCSGKLDRSLMLRGLPDVASVVRLIDWASSRAPEFYSRHHTKPVHLVDEDGRRESWVFHPSRTPKFSGKEVRVEPGRSMESREDAAYVLFIWRGSGEAAGNDIVGANHGCDEFFVGYRAATVPHVIRNTGDTTLVVYKLFGPSA